MNGLADFHHIEFRVTNALQSSFWYCCCFGFQRFAVKQDEDTTCIAIRNGKVIFVMKSTASCDPETLQQLVVHGDAVKDVAFRVDSLDALEQSSFWYCCCFGFQRFAVKQDEDTTCIAIRNGKVIFVMKSTTSCDPETLQQLIVHGDAVKDVAFRVDSIDALEQRLIGNGVDILLPKTTYRDENGSVNILKLQAKDSDITHTLIEDRNYSGTFLPGYLPVDNFPLPASLGNIPVVLLDHVVQNYPVNGIEDAAEWYNRSMALQRFWSIDDKITTSEFSAMKAWLITNDDQKVQMTLAEAVPGRKGRSQIEEYVSYNGGPGIQHIALLVDDIVATVTEMRKRTVEFLEVPPSYYDILEERLKDSKVELKEDMKKLRELCILMDFDDNGYLLQLFTRPVQDRPTLFIEIIQRRNFNGFGAGNFKALFDAVEREQRRRGTLLVEN